MQKIRIIFAAFAIVFVAGCNSTPKTPERIAHTAVATTIETADSAIRVWADYVVRERLRVDQLYVSNNPQYLDAATRLAEREMKVATAYEKYQDVTAAAITGASGLSGSIDVSAHEQIQRAVSALISIVTSIVQ